MRRLIFALARACAHRALFEDERYLEAQLCVLKTGIGLLMEQAKTI